MHIGSILPGVFYIVFGGFAFGMIVLVFEIFTFANGIVDTTDPSVSI